MNRQMAAERRRTVVLEADGSEASVKVAEGAKQAAILSAESGRRPSNARPAAAAILNAGLRRLTRIYESAQAVDARRCNCNTWMRSRLGAGPRSSSFAGFTSRCRVCRADWAATGW